MVAQQDLTLLDDQTPPYGSSSESSNRFIGRLSSKSRSVGLLDDHAEDGRPALRAMVEVGGQQGAHDGLWSQHIEGPQSLTDLETASRYLVRPLYVKHFDEDARAHPRLIDAHT